LILPRTRSEPSLAFDRQDRRRSLSAAGGASLRGGRSHLELSDADVTILADLVKRTIDDARYPLSPRVTKLREILAKLRPEPVREALPADPVLYAHDALDRAVEFFDAFRQLPLLPRGRWISWPRYFLLCHVIEMGLKAFLASRGVPEAKLRRKEFRHNIDRLMREALAKNLNIGVLAASQLMLLGEAHAKHWSRYPREQGKPVFTIDSFEPFARELLQGVSQSIRGGPAQIAMDIADPTL
jgi:hypothetical protein